jgi:D-alanyl-D-alanine endopeptidase (penicillin-binding protein 7)
LKNAVKILLLSVVISSPVFAKKQAISHVKKIHKSTHARPHTTPKVSILATNYIVQNLDTGEILVGRKIDEVRSIASITKLMTAVVVLDAKQDLNEYITVQKPKDIHSRLPNGIRMKRSELLLLALMSSDNVAAKLLAQHYPGGENAAITAMNNKAESLGMTNSKFVDPTGLFAENVSTVQDLSKLVNYAYNFEAIRNYSTTASERVEVPGKKRSRYVDFHTTNSLVATTSNVLLSKTGWIQLSGGCLAMIIKEQDQRLAVILLNSRNTHTRIRDGVLLTEYNNVRNYRN